MANRDVKADRRYTKDHEWARQSGEEVVVGITAFAVDQLGDITLVNMDVKPGDELLAGKAFGTIESVKTLSDLFSPVSGKVLASIRCSSPRQKQLTATAGTKRGWWPSRRRTQPSLTGCSITTRTQTC